MTSILDRFCIVLGGQLVEAMLGPSSVTNQLRHRMHFALRFEYDFGSARVRFWATFGTPKPVQQGRLS